MELTYPKGTSYSSRNILCRVYDRMLPALIGSAGPNVTESHPMRQKGRSKAAYSPQQKHRAKTRAQGYIGQGQKHVYFDIIATGLMLVFGAYFAVTIWLSLSIDSKPSTVAESL